MGPPPAIEGFLVKRGQMGTAKRRYFVLAGPVLAYYAAPEDDRAVPRGQLVLDAQSRVAEVTGRRGFTVSAHRKTWTMTSEIHDAEEVQRWHDAIAAAIASCAAGGARQTPGEGEEENPRYVVTVSGTDFVLDRRYESIKPLGHGAYGVVVSGVDGRTGQKVAIKKCPNVFEDPLDAKRIAREIRLLRHFHHPNIIKVVDLQAPDVPPAGAPLAAAMDFHDVYMVAELMDTDLHRVIYSGQKLTDEHVQFFLYQLLCGIKHIHSANVIHRDLKPSNILLNENCDLKICDFGLARDMGADQGAELPSNLTEYVVTRWYRAPEIMLSSQEYSKAIDMWAAGCIFGEMLGRKPMFPGNDYIHQLKLITRTVGTPASEAELWFVKNPKAKVFMLQLPPCPPQDLAKRFPGASPEALDLLRAMLQLDYQKRVTVDEALDHPYFASVRDTAMEFPCTSPVPWGDIERCQPSRPNLQRTILEDIVAFHLEAQPLLDAHRRRAAEAPPPPTQVQATATNKLTAAAAARATVASGANGGGKKEDIAPTAMAEEEGQKGQEQARPQPPTPAVSASATVTTTKTQAVEGTRVAAAAAEDDIVVLAADMVV